MSCPRIAEDVTAAALPDRFKELLAAGHRLALVAAHHDGPECPDGAGLRVVYLFLAPDPAPGVELHLRLAAGDPVVPSLSGRSFVAGRFEREMHDLYGITPAGHLLPRRLVRHPHWPAGYYPMRWDGPPPEFGLADEPFPFLTVEGPGVYEIPVGPVHAGLIEPGHFRFSVIGETILKLKARLWYVHKGIEKLFEGRELTGGLPLAERISGDTAVGHSLAYCCAVEDALGLRVPAAVHRARAIHLELERLYNHIGDIGALCNDVGHGVLHAHAMRIRESLLRLNAETTGHRLLRGGVHIGGVTLRRVPDPDRLASIAADIREGAELAADNTLVAERFTGTAVLTTAEAHDLGTLGYVARASGVDVDARRDHPTLDLSGFGAALGDVLVVPTQERGDVMARFRQRVAEVDASVALLDVLCRTVTPGSVNVMPDRESNRLGGSPVSGVGIVEGWRGTIVHRVEIGPDHRITRNKVVDPSWFNWPALPVALADTIVPDFPLVNKSFNLSYAGNDL